MASPGEILGIAGVSGNGQKELVQAIGSQRPIEGGELRVHGEPFRPSRAAIREAGLFTLPEEPLQNATVPGMTVAENLALRTFDRSPIVRAGLLHRASLAVLARDLGGGNARIVVVSNPCFGLDFAATAFVHNPLVELRNRGGSVLLVSDDLDELIKLADRILVMSGGAIVHETSRAELDLSLIGQYMGGHVAA